GQHAAEATAVRHSRANPVGVPGHPRAEAARQLAALQRPQHAGRSAPGSEEVHRGRAALAARLRGMKQREAQIPRPGKVRFVEAGKRLVRLYEATNQPDKARTWREKFPDGKDPGS